MSFSQMGTASGEVVLLCSCKDANGFSSEFLTPPIVSLIHLNSCFCEGNDSLRVVSIYDCPLLKMFMQVSEAHVCSLGVLQMSVNN